MAARLTRDEWIELVEEYEYSFPSFVVERPGYYYDQHEGLMAVAGVRYLRTNRFIGIVQVVVGGAYDNALPDPVGG